MELETGPYDLSLKPVLSYWTNGDEYVGDWVEGVPQGYGEFTYGASKRTGERYVGQYDKVQV